ncbi:MAG: hypothetical protein ACTSWI_00640 [Alphaproteobacteria bacterium]
MLQLVSDRVGFDGPLQSAGALFVSGAIGVEMISGAVEAAGMDRFAGACRLAVVFEETLGITGLVLLLVAPLSYASMLGSD